MNKLRKILFLRTPPYDVNISTYNTQQLGMGRAFCDKGFDFDYITFKKKNQKEWVFYEKDGHKCRILEKPRIRLFRTGLNFKILKKEFLSQYDLIICQEYYQIMTHLVSKRHSNVVMYNGPYWNLFHTHTASFLYDLLFTKKIDKHIKYKFTKSELAKNFLEKKGYHNLFNVGVALDTSKYAGIEEKPETKVVSDYMKNNHCLLYVGNINKNKNASFLIRVFEKILKTNNDLKLVMVGKCKPTFFERITRSKKRSYLQKLLKKHPSISSDSVLHVERIDNAQLQFIYPHAEAFLLPSIHEIFGMVLLEAMYFGLPVVSSYNGGSSTLILDDSYGQIIKEFDVDKWCSAVERYLSDKSYWQEVSKNASELIKTKYTWDYITDLMLKEINDGQ